jgi:dCTP deaminase
VGSRVAPPYPKKCVALFGDPEQDPFLIWYSNDMLSDGDILKVMAEGLLVIRPFDKKQVRPAAISLHLGQEILIPRPAKLIDIKNETELSYERQEITEDKPFIIKPQQFVLGHTEEVISVSPQLGFIIEGRSTLARLGISVEQSATIVDPGHHERPITLEIYNCGPSPVTLYARMSIAKALVFRLSSEAGRAFDTYTRYASQKSGVGRPILRLKSE